MALPTTITTLTVNFGFSEAGAISEMGDVRGDFANRFVQAVARDMDEGAGYRKTDAVVMVPGEAFGQDMGISIRLDICPAMLDTSDPIGQALRANADYKAEVSASVEGDRYFYLKRFVSEEDAERAKRYADAWDAALAMLAA